MKKVIRNQIIAVGLIIMAAALVVERGHAAQTPPGPDVRVVNTVTNPVPVSVINFPTGTNTVNVSSSTNAPLLVRDVDKSGRTPFVARAFTSAASRGDTILTNAPGKRIVIETVSVSAHMENGNPNAYLASFKPPVSGTTNEIVEAIWYLALTPQGVPNPGGVQHYTATLPMRAYVLDPGARVVAVFDWYSYGGGALAADFNISGYFEDAP